MPGQFDGRVAIVTGSGAGIGHGIVRELARQGAKIVVAEINSANGAKVAEELRNEFGAEAIFTVTDVSDKASVQAMVQAALDAFGTVDILVNNAYAGFHLSRFEHKTDELFDLGFRLGAMGPVWAMQAVFPTMRAKGYGRIINMCSISGTNALSGFADYNAGKEALRAITRTVAREWAPYGIVANIICPVAKSAASKQTFAEHPELEDAADKENPMGRLGDPEKDIAPVVAFLASEGARYLTGNTLFVSGGAHINGVAWTPDLPEKPN